MDSSWLVPVSLVFGFLVGVGLVSLMHLAAARGERAHRVINASVPDGVDAVIDALDTGGIVVDPSNVVIKASPGALAYGLVAHGALVHPELVAIVNRVRKSGESVNEEVEVARGPFGDVSMAMSVRVARLGSRYVLLLAEDRTESHRLDAVRRDFIANISHELKTPIGAVGLLAEALQAASDEPAQVRRFAKRLTREADRLASITQEIIELSRLQAADALTEASLVSLDEVVHLALDETRVLAEANRVRVVAGSSSKAQVFGDTALLVTALHNLIANAIQYSPKGSRVGVGVRLESGVIEIAVTDQGPGIPEDELDRVFERFFRGDPARSRRTGGSGLGLSIVKHIVQNHGGDVRVWSQVGRGSTFTIRLPEASRTTSAGATP
ncbi:MAG: two-component sensor histidine kinase [Burkholderiaceae bacterium]|nr:two-component sensor histidine kinase [Microbacteriaceae bacterium]